jgi:predicted RNA-binding protein YlqC (UPF0109 family)
MQNPNQSPAGSEPINPILDTPATEQQAAAQEMEPEVKDTPTTPTPDALAKMEARLKEKESMIGKHGNTINALKTEIANMKAQLQSTNNPAPDQSQLLADLYRKMDAGEIGIAEGMNQALSINANLTAQQITQQIAAQQQQREAEKVRSNFLKKNPDYESVVESGALAPYLEEDPLHDNYSAFLLYKKDQQFAEQQKEAEAKINAAKEEGARLAKGAEAAGKVIGKQGQSAVQNSKPKPFKNNQEATAAMLETLKQFRAASST